MRQRSVHDAERLLYPSLEIVGEQIHRTVDAQAERASGLDERGGVLLGFAGLLAGIIFGTGPINDWWALGAALLTLAAAASAAVGMLPRTANAIRPERLIEQYATAPREQTQLILLSTISRLYDEQEDRVGRKGSLVRTSAVLLLCALFTLFVRSLVGDTGWEATW